MYMTLANYGRPLISREPCLNKIILFYHFILSFIIRYHVATVSDKNRWDTLTKRCFFPSRAPLVPLKVVYRSSVTKSCTPTLRGQGDPKVSQPF